MKRQSRCNVQCGKVPQPQEVDLGGHGHGREVHDSDEVGHVHIKTISKKRQSRCNRSVEVGQVAHKNYQHEEVK